MLTKELDAFDALEMSRLDVLQAYRYEEYLLEWGDLFGLATRGERRFWNGRGVEQSLTVHVLDRCGFDSMRAALAAAENEYDALVIELHLLF